MADFTFPTQVLVTTWLSRAPGRVPPYTSLVRTMDAGCWASTLASVVSVSLALLLTVKVGRSYGRPQPDLVKILLTPFAIMNAEPLPSWFNSNTAGRGGEGRRELGRAGNLLLLTWSVMGMIVMFGFTCNLRAIYMKVELEEPLISNL